jgi:CBS domain-containing protein
MRQVTDVDGLTAADVVHSRLTSMEAGATVAEARAYFTESSSHKLAVVADGERFVGSLTASSIPDDAPDDARAADFASAEPTVAPDEPAARARDLALSEPSQRLPVVDGDGVLVGVVAITTDRAAFCGT